MKVGLVISMVCSCFDKFCCALPFLRRAMTDVDDENKKLVERKLYLARESPDPTFDLTDCALTKVPKGIYSICKVFLKDQLVLENNNLKSLQHGGELSELCLLSVLNLKSNLFIELPSSIKLLKNLRELYVDKNALICLPDEIGELTNLKILSLSDNKLTELPKAVSKLTALQYLNIRNNPYLSVICQEICFARCLVDILLDFDTIIDPPNSVTSKGTEEIKRYFCSVKNIEYIDPIEIENISITEPQAVVQVSRSSIGYSESEFEKEQINQQYQLSKLHKASLLKQILEDQKNIESKVDELNQERQKEKSKLLKDLQEEEKVIACIIENMIKFKNDDPQRHQQLIEFENNERNKLKYLFDTNTINKFDETTINSMEKQIEYEINLLKTFNKYDEKLDNLKQTVLIAELNLSDHLDNVFRNNEIYKFELLQQLNRDEEIQKAAVASLLERTDSQSWSLNQEIAIIADNLSRLTHLEIEKKKVNIEYNMNALAQQRVELMAVLQDLFKRQSVRQRQLHTILTDMESKQNTMTNFWLINYQKLLDSIPPFMTDMSRHLDPHFANILLQENVIHCLPFLTKVIFSEPLKNVTDEKLIQLGIKLNVDRIGVLKSIERYLCRLDQPTAPVLVKSDSIATAPDEKLENECVVCMDKESEIVFLPCAHMCCCKNCAFNSIEVCPICRIVIENKIKIILC